MSIQVFSMDDYSWYAGESADACVVQYKKDMFEQAGLTEEEMQREGIPDPTPLTEEQMDQHLFIDDDGSTRSFQEQLQQLLEGKTIFPCLFATTEV